MELEAVEDWAVMVLEEGVLEVDVGLVVVVLVMAVVVLASEVVLVVWASEVVLVVWASEVVTVDGIVALEPVIMEQDMV